MLALVELPPIGRTKRQPPHAQLLAQRLQIDIPTLFGLPETGLTKDASSEYTPQSLLIQPIYTDFSNEYCKGVGCRGQNDGGKDEEEENK